MVLSTKYTRKFFESEKLKIWEVMGSTPFHIVAP